MNYPSQESREGCRRAYAEAATIIERLLTTMVTRDEIAAEYGCSSWLITKIYRTAPREQKLAASFRKLSAQRTGVKTGRVPPHAYKVGEIRGEAARRYVPVGTVLTRRHGNGKMYRWIKVRDVPRESWRNWKSYAVHLWEQANGPVPEGCIILHRNEDSLDDRLDNYECLTLAERLKRQRSNPKTLAKWRAAVARANKRVGAVRRIVADAKKHQPKPEDKVERLPMAAATPKARAGANLAAFLRQLDAA